MDSNSCIATYVYTGRKSSDNDDFSNERIHFFIKYKSLTLYFRKCDVYSVWEMSGDKDGLLIDPSSSLDHSSTSFASWLWLLIRESLRGQFPLSAAGFHFGILSSTDSNRPGTWLYYFLTSTCFRCSFAYLHRCISWLTARLRFNI